MFSAEGATIPCYVSKAKAVKSIMFQGSLFINAVIHFGATPAED